MLFRQWRVGPMANFQYLFASGGEGLVVDPAFDPAFLLREAQTLGVRITHVLVTHGHPDHVNGVDAVRRATGAKVLAHESADHPIDIKLADGQTLDVAGLAIEVLHTPGHRFDSACYLIEGTHVLTGDTLFVGECGRVDLPGSDVRAMHHSLLEKVAKLPGGLIVCPGHDYGPTPLSTIDHEVRTNYTLRRRTLDEFERFMGEP